MTSFDTFIGQPRVTNALKHVVDAAKAQGIAAHHVLLEGPAGLGKSHLSRLVSGEMGVKMWQTTGPSLQAISDLVKIVMDMGRNEVLFIDEIHKMPYRIAVMLYSVMEGGFVDVPLGPSPRMNVHVELQPVTIVGATTHLGDVPGALLSRFGQFHTLHLEYYREDTLTQVLNGYASRLKTQYTPDAIEEVARQGRGTPRIAIDLLHGAAEYALSLCQPLTREIVKVALESVGIRDGLNSLDYKYLFALNEHKDGLAGINALANMLNTEESTLESTVEPWLLHLGLIRRTDRGRVITQIGKARIGA